MACPLVLKGAGVSVSFVQLVPFGHGVVVGIGVELGGGVVVEAAVARIAPVPLPDQKYTAQLYSGSRQSQTFTSQST